MMENHRFQPPPVLRLITVLLQTVFFVPCLIRPTESMMSKIAVVTGANKGIGFAIAKKLAQNPGNTCILTSRDRARGEKAVEELKGKGIDIKFMQLDIGDPASVESFVSQMEEDYGRCDVLVNNAGIAFKAADPTPFKDQAEPTLKTNFFDTVSFTEKMLPLVRKSTAGRIVNVASMSGRLSILQSTDKRDAFTNPDLTKEELWRMMEAFVDDVKSGQHAAKGWPNTCYGMSKLGLIAYTKVAASMEEKAGSKVLINCCCPGYCKTDMSSHLGYLSPDEGASTPVMLSQMKDLEDGGLTGGFFRSMAPSEW